MAASCPICGDFEGDPQSVQAHISAKQDEAHRGKTGREFAADIENGGKNGQQTATKPPKVESGGNVAPSPGGRQNGQQAPENGHANGNENGKVSNRGGRSRGTTVDIPPIACKECGRKVKYPELMTYKATCQGCGRTIRKRKAFERIEQQADEKGKDELAEAKEV